MPTRSRLLVLFCFAMCLAYSQAQVAVTPAKATMLVGESRPFRAVDSQGHMLTNVHWTISTQGLADLAQGAEVEVVAKQPGRFRLTAHAGEGFAEAQVEILQGYTMPIGTVKWSGVDWPGCKTSKIMPAVPSATGVADVFEDAVCADGHYVAAYTAEGIMAWRRKVTSKSGGTPSAEDLAAAAAQPLKSQSASICDSISLHMEKENVRALLAARHLQISSETENAWLIEEEGSECRLWFDEHSWVSKKRKTLITE